jgi:hypothetical protein
VLVQVVMAINGREGNEVAAMPVLYLNQNPSQHEDVGSMRCPAVADPQYWNETTLKNVAQQYSMDVLRFGYM